MRLSNFLTDLNHFEAVNQVYQKFFVGGALPARAVVEVSGLGRFAYDPLCAGRTFRIERGAIAKVDRHCREQDLCT